MTNFEKGFGVQNDMYLTRTFEMEQCSTNTWVCDPCDYFDLVYMVVHKIIIFQFSRSNAGVTRPSRTIAFWLIFFQPFVFSHLSLVDYSYKLELSHLAFLKNNIHLYKFYWIWVISKKCPKYN